MTDEEKKVEKKEQPKEDYEVGEVATQTVPVIVDKEDKTLTTEQALALILNKLTKLEKLL